MSYNGWSNRETWLINVWFNPESPSDIDSIKAQVEEDFENLPDYMRDMINIELIDWDELEEAVSDNENDDDDNED